MLVVLLLLLLLFCYSLSLVVYSRNVYACSSLAHRCGCKGKAAAPAWAIVMRKTLAPLSGVLWSCQQESPMQGVEGVGVGGRLAIAPREKIQLLVGASLSTGEARAFLAPLWALCTLSSCIIPLYPLPISVFNEPGDPCGGARCSLWPVLTSLGVGGRQRRRI